MSTLSLRKSTKEIVNRNPQVTQKFRELLSELEALDTRVLAYVNQNHAKYAESSEYFIIETMIKVPHVIRVLDDYYEVIKRNFSSTFPLEEFIISRTKKTDVVNLEPHSVLEVVVELNRLLGTPHGTGKVVKRPNCKLKKVRT